MTLSFKDFYSDNAKRLNNELINQRKIVCKSKYFITQQTIFFNYGRWQVTQAIVDEMNAPFTSGN